MTEEPTSEAIIVCGVPASGKTTFAQGLARELRWTYLDLDTLTNPLFEYMGGEFLVDVPTSEPRRGQA
jgi:tRNA uridine 5-carbamoylmethylation protein Kti12